MRRLVVVLLGVASYALLGCEQSPKMDVKPVIENGQVVFEVPHKGIISIHVFRIEDEDGKPLWDLHTTYKGHRIIYGVAPASGSMRAQQKVPPEGEIPVPIRGRTVIVTVVYEYDENMTPSAGTYRKTVQIP